MGGAGGSLRAGVTENPVRLTRSVKEALTRVTCGGAPVYVWPGGGITFMVDVTRVPDNAFGYVPTPALVAPIEFTLRLADYAALGGHMDQVRPLSALVRPTSGGRCRTARQSLAARAATRRRVGMRDPPRHRLLPDGRRLHLQRRADRPDHRGVRRRPRQVARAYRGRGAPLRRPCSTSSAASCRCCARRSAGRVRCKAPVARRMYARGLALCRRRLHHADGGGGGRRRRGDAGGHDRGGAARPRLCQQWRRHRPPSCAGRRASRIGLVDRPDRPGLFGTATIRADDPVRGIATSGWRGRSFSLGIADAVTVLAATRRGGRRRRDHHRQRRRPARPSRRSSARPPATIQPDSDLGDAPRDARRRHARRGRDRRGARRAATPARERAASRAGLIAAAALHLAGRHASSAAAPIARSPPNARGSSHA